jgi:UDP-N-acetylmuramoyl-tripeptide--D-alanyl-D-alanine ligase
VPHARAQQVRMSGIELICDFYNANPVSMRASLELLDEARRASGGRAWACLGDMAELASASEELHRSAARQAHALRIDHVIVTGAASRHVVDELRRLNPDAHAWHVDSCAAMAEAVLHGVAPADVVLVKGSRASRLEAVWEHLAQALWVRDMRAGRVRQ